jgi:hypothetical protein
MYSAVGPLSALVSVMVTSKAVNISLMFVGSDAVLIYMLLRFPELTWSSFVEISPELDAILPDAGARAHMGRWIRRRLNLRNQALVSVLAGCLGGAAGYVVLSSLRTAVAPSIAYLASTTAICALGANALWWLVSTSLLARAFANLSEPQLDWVAPLNTPGIRHGRLLLLKSAGRTVLGSIVLVGPLVAGLLARPQAPAIVAVIFFAATISFGGTVFVLVVPQYWLTRIVANYRSAACEELRRQLPPTILTATQGSVANTLDIYRWIEHRRVAIWDVRFLATLFVAVAEALGSCAAAVIALLQ